jgi:Uma2 family endonuclease
MPNLAHNPTPNIPLPPPAPPKKRPRPARFNYYKMVSQLPPASTLVLNDVSWQEYEDLLAKVGEAKGMRISFAEGVMQVMTLSIEHEGVAAFIQDLVRLISLRLRVKVLFFGSATMKRAKKDKGSEPDLCFYLQSVPLLQNPARPNFAVDPPPDVVVEIDIHHKSLDKFPIYAALGVPEMWRYDGKRCTLHGLANGEYVLLEMSQALPLLTGEVLTSFLNRLRDEDQYDVLLAFEEWLNQHA